MTTFIKDLEDELNFVVEFNNVHDSSRTDIDSTMSQNANLLLLQIQNKDLLRIQWCTFSYNNENEKNV